MSEFNWANIDRISRLTNRNTQDVIRLIGEEVQRQGHRQFTLGCREDSIERRADYTSSRVERLETEITRLKFYTYSSCLIEIFLLAYLLWGSK